MDNTELEQILNAINNLLEETASMTLFDSIMFDDIVKELTAASIFHNQVELLRRLDDLWFTPSYLIKLDDVIMADSFENVNLTGNPFDISLI